MSPGVFAAVTFAAALHAIWNALVKGGDDRRMRMGAVVLGHVPFAAAACVFVPAPDAASWLHLAAGILLHFGYQLFLLRSYESGDLTQVYPLARGSAPLIVALFSVLVLGVELSPMELIAIATIGTGIVSLAFVRRQDGQRNTRAAMLALVTGSFIASYSLVDGLGARLAGTALGYFGWLAIGNGIVMLIYLAATTPDVLGRVVREGRGVVLIGGGGSFFAYALVTWAFTQAPIALVTALRETSIVFALLIGVFVLKERLDLAKVASTMTTLLGTVLLRFARSSS
ncbi:MAG: DMT family transporter [Thermoanaerobaculia bacterium]|nr:DMT family transporter [Thermoanaerobaculia bacterium]